VESVCKKRREGEKADIRATRRQAMRPKYVAPQLDGASDGSIWDSLVETNSRADHPGSADGREVAAGGDSPTGVHGYSANGMSSLKKWVTVSNLHRVRATQPFLELCALGTSHWPCSVLQDVISVHPRIAVHVSAPAVRTAAMRHGDLLRVRVMHSE
jgi:hypothetical protein